MGTGDRTGPGGTPPGGEAAPATSPARRTGPSSPRALLVLAWVTATLLGGAVAWSAVTVVAGERGQGTAGVLDPDQVAQRLAEAPPGGATSTPSSPPRTTTPTGAAPGAGATGTPPTGTPPTGTPSTGTPSTGTPSTGTPSTGTPSTGTPSTGTAPTGTPPATGPGGAPPPAAAVPSVPDVARTWGATGGQVGAVCRGATIQLLYATPADGWTVEVGSAGPQRVEVDFTRDGARSRVRAECVAGTPELRGGGDTGGGGGGGEPDDGGGDERDDGSGRSGGGDGGDGRGDDGGGDGRGGGDDDGGDD